MALFRPRFPANQKGYTLPEMSITILITSIIVLTMATILVSSRRIYQNSTAELELQREYTIIINLLTRSIRQSLADSSYIYTNYTSFNQGSPSLAGNCLRLRMPAQLTRIFYLDQHNLILIDENNLETCFASDLVQNLHFYYGSVADSNQYLNFDLSLANDKDTLSTNQTVSFRN